MTFAEFYTLYPKKMARPVAEKSWNRLSPAEREAALKALPNHIRTWDDRQFIPYPATWLNQRRWEDEIEPVQHKVTAWWTSPAAIDAKARELGIQARPGDGYEQLKQRISDKLRAA